MTSLISNRILPGLEWYYFKIKINPAKATSILLALHHVLNEHDYIIGWYFVRYADPEPELRIRVKLKHFQYQGLLHSIISNFVNNLNTEKYFVRDFSIHTYNREIDRYHEANFPIVEQVFMMDTELVLAQLANTNGATIPSLAFANLEHYLGAMYSEPAGRLQFVKESIENFRLEYENTSENKRIVNDILREQSKTINSEGVLWLREIDLLVEKLPVKNRNIFWSIIHMSMNRLFYNHQRSYEFISYCLYQRVCIANQYRSKSTINLQPHVSHS